MIIIAELGCNHQGSIITAKNMIDKAAEAGVDYIKLQKRDVLNYPAKWLKEYNSLHAFGKTYLEHRQNLEFTIDQHRELKEYAEEKNIKYSTSVWDMVSAKQIRTLCLDYVKIPSALNRNKELISYCINNYKEVHVSTGMLTNKEKEELLDYLTVNVVVYHTTSEYPAPFDKLFLKEITKLKLKGLRVGYSGHNQGIAVDIAAYTLGATYFERHFTLDRTFKGTDNAASLEPQGLSKLVRDLKATEQALNYKTDITEGELINRKKLGE